MENDPHPSSTVHSKPEMLIRNLIWWFIKMFHPPDMKVTRHPTWKAPRLHTWAQTGVQRLISSLVFKEMYSSLWSPWSQVPVILKCCVSHLTVALLEHRSWHTVYYSFSALIKLTDCVGGSKASCKTVASVATGKSVWITEALKGEINDPDGHMLLVSITHKEPNELFVDFTLL